MSRLLYRSKPLADRRRDHTLITQAEQAIRSATYVSAQPGSHKGWLKVIRRYPDSEPATAFYRPAKRDWRGQGESDWRPTRDPDDFLDQFAPGAHRGHEWELAAQGYTPAALNTISQRKQQREQHRQDEAREAADSNRRSATAPPPAAPTRRAPDRPPAHDPDRANAPGPPPRPPQEPGLGGSAVPLADNESNAGRGVEADPPPEDSAPQTRQRVPNGVIPRHVAFRSQLDVLAPVTAEASYEDDEMRANGRSFLVHVLASYRSAEREPVPIYCRLIEDRFGVHRTEDVWEPLAAVGAVTVLPPDREAGLSRAFTPAAHLVADYWRSGSVEAEGPLVNVDTGRPSRSRKRRGRVHPRDSNGTRVPDLYVDAVTKVVAEGCPFDHDRAVASVKQRDQEASVAERAWRSAGRPPSGPVWNAMVAAHGRFANDAYCLSEMLKGDLTGEGRVRRYRMRVGREPQSGGRLTEYGGLQNGSRQFKHDALAPLWRSQGVLNYDMKSSQAWAFIQEAEDAGVDPAWLREYVRGDREAYVERAFGTRDVPATEAFKRSVLALLMGASLPESLAEPAERRRSQRRARLPKIAEYIRDAFGDGERTDEGEAALNGFRSVVEPLVHVRELWFDQLEYEVASGKYRLGGRGGNWVENAAKHTLDTSGLTGWKLRSKLAAHFLQGREAAFIYHLVLLGDTHGFRAVSLQHDGVVTVGEVPDSAVQEARESSGLRYVTLVQKRYHPDMPVPGLDDE